MKPHDKAFRRSVINHFWPLDDAPSVDLTFQVIRNCESDALIFPIVQILGGVDVYAYLCRITLDFVLSKPVISSFVKQDPATVRIDVDPLIVRPRLIREKLAAGLDFHARESSSPMGRAVRPKPNLSPKVNGKGKCMTFFCPRGVGGD